MTDTVNFSLRVFTAHRISSRYFFSQECLQSSIGHGFSDNIPNTSDAYCSPESIKTNEDVKGYLSTLRLWSSKDKRRNVPLDSIAQATTYAIVNHFPERFHNKDSIHSRLRKRIYIFYAINKGKVFRLFLPINTQVWNWNPFTSICYLSISSARSFSSQAKHFHRIKDSLEIITIFSLFLGTLYLWAC